MRPVNISSLIKKYGPGYVAKNRKTGRVLAHAKKLDILFKKTKNKTNIIFSWVPKASTLCLSELKTIDCWREFSFLVDTGADLTTVPSHLLPILGINKSKLVTGRTLGVVSG